MVLSGSRLNIDRRHHAAAGAIAGVAARTCTAPLDVLRTRQQVFGCVPAFAGMPWQSWFRGNGINCIRAAPAGAIQFTLYQALRDEKCSRLTSATAAGCVSISVLYPLDILKTVWQVHDTHCMRSCAALVVNQGKGHLLRGYGMSVVAFVPFFATQFALYDTIKGRAHPQTKVEFAACSVFATLPAAVFWYPLDTIRRRIQVSAPQAVSVRMLYAGFGPACCKNIVLMAVRMVVYESLLNNDRFRLSLLNLVSLCDK
jgi:hypothetical protein